MSHTEDHPDRSVSGSFRDVAQGIWSLREAGPSEAERTVLLLAGALATARCYDALVGHPEPDGGDRPAGCGHRSRVRTDHGADDVSIEKLRPARGGSRRRPRGADAVAGHSLGANVALEMALTAGYSGPVVLLSPSLCRRDESMFPRALDRMSPSSAIFRSPSCSGSSARR